MKVIPKDNAKSGIAGWLSKDEPVTVLAISIAPSLGSRFLIWSKLQKTAALFQTEDFEIVDNRVPSAWIASIDLNGNVEFAPTQWLGGDFWDRYNNSDPVAERLFSEVVKLIEE